jgi:hypothetical protein
VIGNGLGLIDFKTSAKGVVYTDQLVAMAAHGKLWMENRPGQPLTADYHLVVALQFPPARPSRCRLCRDGNRSFESVPAP